jgi:hypothetical protein
LNVHTLSAKPDRSHDYKGTVIQEHHDKAKKYFQASFKEAERLKMPNEASPIRERLDSLQKAGGS